MSVTKMKDGKRWYVFVRYKDWTGATRQHKKEGFARKADAQAYEREFRLKVQGSPDMTVRALYQLYIEDCRARLRPTTMKGKESIFKLRILPYFADQRVGDITSKEIRKWQNMLMEAPQNFSQTYLRRVHGQMSALYNYAVKYYGVRSNPCLAAGSIGRGKADAMQFWTVDEFREFLDALGGDIQMGTAFSILFWTGIRSGELLALTPEDFDFSVPSVSISKNYARQNKTDLIMAPKTPKGRRVVLMPHHLADQVQRYLGTLYGLGRHDRIFPTWHRETLSRALRKVCAQAGLRRIRVHDLRHSHASLLIDLGFSPLLIAERLGHEKIETTLQTYGHLYPHRQAELIAKLDEL